MYCTVVHYTGGGSRPAKLDCGMWIENVDGRIVDELQPSGENGICIALAATS